MTRKYFVIESVIVFKIMIMLIKTSVSFRSSRQLPHVVGSGLMVLLQVLDLSLQVLLCILHSHSVDELKHIPAKAQPKYANIDFPSTPGSSPGDEVNIISLICSL